MKLYLKEVSASKILIAVKTTGKTVSDPVPLIHGTGSQEPFFPDKVFMLVPGLVVTHKGGKITQ